MNTGRAAVIRCSVVVRVWRILFPFKQRAHTIHNLGDAIGASKQDDRDWTGARFTPDVPTTEKVGALEAVLHSETFARSDKLRDLLRFLCEAEIQGRLDALNEYTIGVEALGRPDTFSPSDDSSVRSRSYELRQKLSKFYKQEARDASIQIELRKGSYQPRFLRITDSKLPKPGSTDRAVPRDGSADAEAQRGPNQSLRVGLIGFLAGIVFAIIGVAAWTGLQSRSAPDKTDLWSPELEAIWKPFLAKGVATIIAYERPMFVRAGHLAVRDPDVNYFEAVPDSAYLMKLKNLFQVPQLKESRSYVDAGTAQAMFYLTRLLTARISNLRVEDDAQLSADDYRQNNLILIGRPWTNPRMRRLLVESEFIDEKSRIRNLHPRSGEQGVYEDENEPEGSDRWGRKYAVISSLPNESAEKHILCLFGRGSEHPAALAYYMTDRACVKDLYQRMRREAKSVPESFQVVVRAEFDRRAPVKVQSVALRVLSVKK